jgi:hypothetical protein
MVDAWFGGVDSAIDEEARSQAAWRRISRDPTSVVILRGAVDLAAQTVRITQAPGGDLTNQPTGAVSQNAVIVYGVRDHPDVTIADTNIRISDKFVFENRDYLIKSIVMPPGEIHAYGEQFSG